MGEDPFNQAFGAGGASAALELEAEPVQAKQRVESLPPVEAEETKTEQRARQITQIAAYGPAPAKLAGAPLYCVRVVLRKRTLAEELAVLSTQRKRADDIATEALAKLGEALYALRRDPQLVGLSKQLAALGDADDQVGHVEAQSQKRKQTAADELERLDRELERLERAAAPLREREIEINQQLDQTKAQLRRAEMLRRKLEVDLEAARRSKGGVDPERLSALQAERDARHGEVQTLGIQMRPVEDDLSAVRRELAQRMRAIATLQDEKQTTVAALGRAQQTQRVSFGSAKGARLQALISLASGALKQGLGAVAPECTGAVEQSAERADYRRQLEELHRAALHSYDPKAYNHGLTALLSGSVLFFLSLALMIFL